MTTVIAARTDDALVIGSDLLATSGYQAGSRQTIKWAVGEQWAVGCAGYLRGVNEIQALSEEGAFDLAPLTIGSLCNGIESRLRQDGYASSGERGPADIGDEYLAVDLEEERLFHIDSTFAWEEVGSFWAIGSGAPYALGVLATYYREPIGDLSAVVINALETAETFDIHSGGAWVYVVRGSDPEELEEDRDDLELEDLEVAEEWGPYCGDPVYPPYEPTILFAEEDE